MIFENLARKVFGAKQVVTSGYEVAERNSDLKGLIGYNSIFDINPAFPIEFIEIFKKLAVINPDISQAVQKIMMLGNNGHSIDVSAKTEAAASNAMSELNAIAKRGFGTNAGLDGFLNQSFRQIMITGALSQEVLISQDLSGVDEVYQVKTSSIRFKLIDGKYSPFQKSGIRDIALNPELYTYIPLISDEDSPYGLPPMLAALVMVLRQDRQWLSIDDYMSLWGILGMTHIKTEIGRNMGETEGEYVDRARKYFQKVYDDFVKGVKKGIAVTNRATDIAHHNVSQSTGNMANLIQALEQQIASGIDIDPAMLGRTYSTTETYATVCYETLLGKIGNIRRIIKRAVEHAYNTHLLLRGVQAECSLKFNDAPSLKVKERTEADEIRQNMVLARLNAKIIDPDTAARELGYDKAYKTNSAADNANSSNSKTLNFVFDKESDKYVYERERAVLSKKKLTTALITR